MKRCAACGLKYPAGDPGCPECSKTTHRFGEQGSMELPDSSAGSWRDVMDGNSTLYECVPCERLVEVQNYQGRTVVPRFCPWCGGEVASLIGRELDGYRIDRQLAEGGFGVLYIASNIAEPKMKSVVKFLRPHMGYVRPELVRVFVEEARLTEEIGQTCWNIVRVSNVRDTPWPYFMEEYIRGTTLQAAIDASNDEGIDIEECKGYLQGMAKALVATHAHGRVHRDLKPLNVMVLQRGDLKPEERVKLLDFGLSLKIAGAKASLDVTRLSDISSKPSDSPLQSAGTPEYMPPEAFDGMNDFTGDIYSFGITAYEVLTGRGPWDDPPPGVDRFFHWRDTHKSRLPRPLRELRSDVPGWLAKVIAKCLEKDKARRIGTAEELAAELREPLPFWVWPTTAAALLFVVVLAYFAILSPSVERMGFEKLLDDRNSKLENATFWVSRAADLANRRLYGSLTAKNFTGDCETSVRGVECSVDAGLVQVSFPETGDLESLVNQTISITGAGEADGKSIRLQGEVQVRLDEVDPVIDPEVSYQESPEKSAPLRPGARLRSSVRLKARVNELNPAKAQLYAERLDRVGAPPLEIPGEEGHSVGEETEYTFALRTESASEFARYRISITAWDHAGNKDTTLPFEVTVDDSVELILRGPKERQSYLAGGSAFYEIDTEEVLRGFEARSRKDGARLETELYKRPVGGELNSLSLALKLRGGKLERWTDSEVLANKSYLLAVKAPREEAAPFELHVTDDSVPPNEIPAPNRTIDLPYVSPKSPAPDDVGDVLVQFQGGERVTLKRSEEKGSLEFRLKSPTRANRVERILVDVAEDRFQSASWEVDEKKGECQVAATRIILEPDNFTMKDGKDTVFSLQLRDALGSTLETRVVLRPDTTKPILTAKVTSPGWKAGYHNVTRWEDLGLKVIGNEPLAWVTASLKGDLLRPESGGPGTEWGFMFSRIQGGVQCRDGEYMLVIEGEDPAGNTSGRIEHRFVINGEDPTVNPVGSQQDSPDAPLVLRSDRLVLNITDGNSLSYKAAEVSIVHWPPEEPSARRNAGVIPLKPPTDSSRGDHTISLEGLAMPAACDGEITVRIADTLGRQKTWTQAFEMRRSRRHLQPREFRHGLEWVLVRVGDRDLYVTRHEVSMAAYKSSAPGFLEKGKYADAALVKSLGRERPLYWGPGDAPLPYCVLEDGEEIRGDLFPMVGVTPLEAEAFARRLGARLPTWEEWQAAAWLSNPLRRYPWEEIPEGKRCAHVRGSALRKAHGGKWYTGSGKEIRDFEAVEVTRDVLEDLKDLSPETIKRLDFKNEFFHIVGNVGELVRLGDNPAGVAAYGVAGGHFNMLYDIVSIQKDPKNPMKYSVPDKYTGFRMVAPANESFLSAPKEIKR